MLQHASLIEEDSDRVLTQKEQKQKEKERLEKREREEEEERIRHCSDCSNPKKSLKGINTSQEQPDKGFCESDEEDKAEDQKNDRSFL